jgi:hypothetical protein
MAMNERMIELIEQAGMYRDKFGMFFSKDKHNEDGVDLEKFIELLMRVIYDEIKEELIPDELVDIEPDSFNRQYLKGCNDGITDALYIVKNFGVDIDEL